MTVHSPTITAAVLAALRNCALPVMLLAEISASRPKAATPKSLRQRLPQRVVRLLAPSARHPFGRDTFAPVRVCPGEGTQVPARRNGWLCSRGFDVPRVPAAGRY